MAVSFIGRGNQRTAAKSLTKSMRDIQSACECVKNSLEVSTEEIKQIDQQTVDQSLSDKWHAVRRHRLTDPVFHSVICRREKPDPKALLKTYARWKL
jgi:hypothetical protein